MTIVKVMVTRTATTMTNDDDDDDDDHDDNDDDNNNDKLTRHTLLFAALSHFESSGAKYQHNCYLLITFYILRVACSIRPHTACTLHSALLYRCLAVFN